jgi:hypothetical protein
MSSQAIRKNRTLAEKTTRSIESIKKKRRILAKRILPLEYRPFIYPVEYTHDGTVTRSITNPKKIESASKESFQSTAKLSKLLPFQNQTTTISSKTKNPLRMYDPAFLKFILEIILSLMYH